MSTRIPSSMILPGPEDKKVQGHKIRPVHIRDVSICKSVKLTDKHRNILDLSPSPVLKWDGSFIGDLEAGVLTDCEPRTFPGPHNLPVSVSKKGYYRLNLNQLSWDVIHHNISNCKPILFNLVSPLFSRPAFSYHWGFCQGKMMVLFPDHHNAMTLEEFECINGPMRRYLGSDPDFCHKMRLSLLQLILCGASSINKSSIRVVNGDPYPDIRSAGAKTPVIFSGCNIARTVTDTYVKDLKEIRDTLASLVSSCGGLDRFGQGFQYYTSQFDPELASIMTCYATSAIQNILQAEDGQLQGILMGRLKTESPKTSPAKTRTPRTRSNKKTSPSSSRSSPLSTRSSGVSPSVFECQPPDPPPDSTQVINNQLGQLEIKMTREGDEVRLVICLGDTSRDCRMTLQDGDSCVLRISVEKQVGSQVQNIAMPPEVPSNPVPQSSGVEEVPRVQEVPRPQEEVIQEVPRPQEVSSPQEEVIREAPRPEEDREVSSPQEVPRPEEDQEVIREVPSPEDIGAPAPEMPQVPASSVQTSALVPQLIEPQVQTTNTQISVPSAPQVVRESSVIPSVAASVPIPTIGRPIMHAVHISQFRAEDIEDPYSGRLRDYYFQFIPKLRQTGVPSHRRVIRLEHLVPRPSDVYVGIVGLEMIDVGIFCSVNDIMQLLGGEIDDTDWVRYYHEMLYKRSLEISYHRNQGKQSERSADVNSPSDLYLKAETMAQHFRRTMGLPANANIGDNQYEYLRTFFSGIRDVEKREALINMARSGRYIVKLRCPYLCVHIGAAVYMLFDMQGGLLPVLNRGWGFLSGPAITLAFLNAYPKWPCTNYKIDIVTKDVDFSTVPSPQEFFDFRVIRYRMIGSRIRRDEAYETSEFVDEDFEYSDDEFENVEDSDSEEEDSEEEDSDSEDSDSEEEDSDSEEEDE